MKKSIFVLVYITIFNCSCNDNLKGIRKTFGTGQNIARQKYHLVPVTDSFQLNEDDAVEERRFIFVNKKESKLEVPGYLRKIILLDTSKQYISFEEDYFKNPVEKMYLIVRHEYISNLTHVTLQTIADDPMYSQGQSITEKQADSILKSWKISLNPF
jgi:hypothetical protein